MTVKASGVTLNHITIRNSGMRGLAIYGKHVKVLNSLITQSGESGVSAHRADGLKRSSPRAGCRRR